MVSLTFGIATGIRGLAWESELTLWTDTEKKYPDDVRAISSLGGAYKEFKIYDNAEYYLSLAVKGWEKLPIIRENIDSIALAYNYLGDSQLSQGKTDQAIKSYYKSLECANYWAPSYLDLGFISFNDGDYRNAAKHFKNAVKHSPEDANLRLNLGSALYLLKNYDNALKFYNEAIRINPNMPLA